MIATYNTLYLDARRQLKLDGSDNPQLEAQELLCFAANKDKLALLQDMSLYAAEDVIARFQNLMERRLRGEPTAYLLGEWSFHGMDLEITPQVLIPRDDTEVLAQQAISRCRVCDEECRVLDLCTGSGCVGLAIAHDCPNANVVLGDISKEALLISRQNTRKNGLTNRVISMEVDVLQPPPASVWDFDLVVCNPPYIPSGDLSSLDRSVQFEPKLALDGGEDGLAFYRSLTQSWISSLRIGGWLMVEVGIGQAPAVEELFRQAGLVNIRTYLDTAGIGRVVEGQVDDSDLASNDQAEE